MIPHAMLDSHNAKAMARAEAAWLEPDEPPVTKCPLDNCIGNHCRLRRHCPDTDKLGDYLYHSKKD